MVSDEKKKSEISKSPIKYWLYTASTFMFVMGIYPSVYLKDKSMNGALNFALAQTITQWAMKISQINTLGIEYFKSRNITKTWQILVDCLIPAKIVFGYDINNNTIQK
eukprot:773445_1